MTQSQPEEYYCTACGGTNIIVEAHCYWNNVKQDFADFEPAESGWDNCADCGNDGAEFRPITDVKTLAQIAINREEANAATVVA